MAEVAFIGGIPGICIVLVDAQFDYVFYRVTCIFERYVISAYTCSFWCICTTLENIGSFAAEWRN